MPVNEGKTNPANKKIKKFQEMEMNYSKCPLLSFKDEVNHEIKQELTAMHYGDLL